ncbi:hypothetical protein NPIL_485651 [Nephila pilipes]|uniref:Uncharacterized protein n=1 Tax=Nephila pilipes TaxID=299642 RepID=A0A8X6QKC8_NEPPI|nr:hypothetical protein NPIL_485651 [Nephila pilipes]
MSTDQKTEPIEEFVPVIFGEPNESIIPNNVVNRNYFEFVQHVIRKYECVISEIILKGIWKKRYTIFNFESADELEFIQDWESNFKLCKFRNRDLKNTRKLFEFINPKDDIYSISYFEKFRFDYCISSEPILFWNYEIKKLIDSFRNLEITFRLNNNQLVSIKNNVLHFNNVIKSLYGFDNSKRKVCHLDELFTIYNPFI